ncbi:MAG: 50S ribosomal protein L4 [Candidatus Omnitrophota bacterium]|nr:50S ribosomal protein L4 [Candidatus Omnitrophota bacterium]
MGVPTKKQTKVQSKNSKVNDTSFEFKLPVYNLEGKEADQIKLDKSVFNADVNKKVLYQAILSYQANMHYGNASTKTRGEVSGGGKKPWRQKGTGRARAGSTRSPLWRHGGVTFGPHPRERGYAIPNKIKLLALKSSLNAKLKNESIVIIDEFKLNKDAKTKQAVEILSRLPNLTDGRKLKERTLGILGAEANTLRCLRNIQNLELVRPCDVTAYNILAAKKILISKSSLKEIARRITGK